MQGGGVAQGVAGGGKDAALQLGKDAFDGRQVFFLVGLTQFFEELFRLCLVLGADAVGVG